MGVLGGLRAAVLLYLIVSAVGLKLAVADGDINNVNHIIVVMQSGHSFDNYLGALTYAPGNPYHNGAGACDPTDHSCVDGLTCGVDGSGKFSCANTNADVDGSMVSPYHAALRCVAPALDPSWFFTHIELNFFHPNRTWDPQNDGFLRVKGFGAPMGGNLQAGNSNQAMAFFNQRELPFYYDLAQKFAIGDRYFASVPGPGFPNRAYLMAATSFGHVTSNDMFPPPGGYRPTTGTIFDLFNANGVSWANYFQDVPQGSIFLPFDSTSVDPHFLPYASFLAQAAGTPGTGTLPQVSFVDPNFGLLDQGAENDELPSTDVQRGQAFVSQLINVVRNGPYWKDSVIFLIYDQHGGFYDHVPPPAALQGGARTPDGIEPGQCTDLSNPPLSQQSGQGAECQQNASGMNGTSTNQAELLCYAFALDPTVPYPSWCASFDYLGVRVPFLAISPFSKPHFVSHAIGDHTSVLAFIERRFLSPDGSNPLFLTLRDQNANPLKNLFDFDNSPSLNTSIAQASLPDDDCTVSLGATRQHTVLLSWASNASPISAYAVYRGDTTGGPYTRIRSVPSGTASYADSSVVSGQTYYYVVTSVDFWGLESDFSPEVSVTIPGS